MESNRKDIIKQGVSGWAARFAGEIIIIFFNGKTFYSLYMWAANPNAHTCLYEKGNLNTWALQQLCLLKGSVHKEL